MSERTRLSQASPIFPVSDLHRALAGYASLGFVTTAYADGDQYGYADRDGVSLHLAARDTGTAAEGCEAYLKVADADALYEEWTRPGCGGLTRRVRDTPYGLREGAHIDVDGNVIRFGSPLSASRPQRLRAHLEARLGVEVERLSELDVGVFRVELRDRTDWVARVFPATRPMAVVAGDAAILTFLADDEFPAERCAAPEPVTELDGRAVLITEYVDAVPREARRTAIRDAGGLRRLGELLGRLHALPDGPGRLGRPGGAWHHLADGRPQEEIAAAGRLLRAAVDRVAPDQRPLYESMRSALDRLDVCEDLPQALTHPDFVLANVIASPDRGLVVVDWAGPGHGARLWSLAWLLFAEGLKDVRRVDRVVAGYRSCVELEPEELTRLAAVLPARWVTLRTWEFGMGRKSLTDAAREIAHGIELAEAISAAARAAFTSTATG